MFEKISNDSISSPRIPYNTSDVKASNFEEFSDIFTKKYEPAIQLDFPKLKKTKAQELYDNWSNVDSCFTPEFFDKIVEISKRVKCDPEDLIGLMYNESRLKPTSVSKDGKYHGLIQFNSTSLKACVKNALDKKLDIQGLDPNITVSKLDKLSREEQLPYVEAYLMLFKDYCGLKGKKVSGGELWGMIKSPAQTKAKNKKFLQHLQDSINSAKLVPLKYETPFYLRKAD